ncbi:hypothetical protein COV42_02275 [Candidatus Campbellbacteria bacterium CG11_big_fil_rev_8_21_14_0_20_44_21]|uniref:Cation-transporting P-type ATPase N-terminal domain-containing protein n=1 Tax=Candidatus Campbellbacteria bacterium CG22_combo_CG10-13_8_21_14_all_43_18 TaxID=1974530 RepID=A0A2H0DWP2_9BACT|nr:MAG: hypothetical protein COW82_02275 [Candidatus Campbellbacteria bacterium CG22_combo_CG10-13_8_21_14_all_43_18]PIR24167.1 MAG: hypothetical protein COV42_02275 [Candidatus Campbellbacteria bacterium CG11_big_fil_rev_8_21_14_0_20_44_21]
MALLGPKIEWHTLSKENVAETVDTDTKKGLSDKEATKRREKYGRNILKEEKTDTIASRVLKQIKSPLVFVLIIAGIITFILGENVDTLVIFIAVFINIIIGVIQEGRASKAFDKLRKSQIKRATVIRDGLKKIILAEDLVRGDVAVLESGQNVPADIRILESRNLEINESILTGEWIDVSKDTRASSREGSLSDQSGVAFAGTTVSGGTGKGIVVEIGANTEIGKIAESLRSGEEGETPIQRNMHRIARFLTLIISLAVLLIFILGLLRGEPIGEILLISIAVAVSVIPEGLPAAVTVVLAIGMERILSKGGLVRNLLAAETLGSTTVILTDKTGTLTEAKMCVAELYTINSITGGDRNEDKKTLIKYGVLASDAFVEENPEKSEMIVRGRPIEKALLLKGLEEGFNQDELENEGDERIDFLPFDSENRFAASLDRYGGKGAKKRIYISGSPEHLLEKTSFVYKRGRPIRINENHLDAFKKIQERKSAEGYRFIAVSYMDADGANIESFKDIKSQKEFFKNFVFMGLISFEDPIREGIRESIRKAKDAGARVIMVTGDHKYTALKVAEDTGIAGLKDRFLEGGDVERMNDKDLLETLKEVKVFARILPSQKERLVKILRGAGEIVAMTGDGVNDAPALHNAHIGVAVGSGTEVAKEASDLILLDNSFSIIVSAIEEGRRIIDNLKKIIAFLFSTSFGEIFVISGALIFNMPLPILTAQILWINLVEGGAMNFAFAFEPTEKGVMRRNPHDIKKEGILNYELKKLIMVVGLVTSLLGVTVFFVLMRLGLPIEEVRTMMFVVLTLDVIFFSFSFKTLGDPVWKSNLFSNKILLLAIFISLALLFGAFIFDPLKNILSLSSLTNFEIMALVGLGILNLSIIELSKYLVFRRRRRV